MTAETVYEVAQVLDETQQERLRQLLNTNVERNPIIKQKKKQLWEENKLRERIINDFKKRAREFKMKNTLPYSSLRVEPISFTTQVKPTYKVSAKKRKIYNNTYRLKCKGYRVEPHKHTIYAYDEEVMNTTQAKNLMKLGFVVQLEIK